MILSNQRFSALGMNMHVKSLGRSMALPACSAAVVRGFPLSSYGSVSVPARNAPACSAFCPPFPAFLCCSVLVLSYGSYSCSGGVNLAGMWWRSVGVLCVEVVWKGGGAGFEPMACSVEVLRFRASHQCCTEAMSEVGCNSSPILLGKLLDIIKLLCIECKFSDLGTIVILGRLEWP